MKQQYDDPDTMPLSLLAPEVPCVYLESEPGDLIVFLEEVYHSAFGGRAGRPRIALNFEASPFTDARIEIMKAEYTKTVYMYCPARSLLASDSRRLRDMVVPLHDLGFDIFNV